MCDMNPKCTTGCIPTLTPSNPFVLVHSRSSSGGMEPRPYQAEAFDAARKANVVMVGATGVGKVRDEERRR